MARPLRAVPDEPAPPAVESVPASVYGASHGSYRDLLIALRDRIAADIDAGVAARDLASLSKRLMEIAAEVEKLDAEGGGEVGEAAETPDSDWEPV